MANPTNRDLLESVYSDVHDAFILVKTAWTRGQFQTYDSHQMLELLRRANAAMQSLDSRIRGNQPPEIGP